jgi:hypothetical protein
MANQDGDLIHRLKTEQPRPIETAPRDDADWLWQELMAWCKAQRMAPADHSDLFDIVGRLRVRQVSP